MDMDITRNINIISQLHELREEYELYRSLYDDCVDLFEASDKSWSKDYPKTKSERQKVKSNCGRSCFLDPENLKYPICDKYCNKRCDGILSAYKRARQQKRYDISKKAINVAKYHGCDWAKGK